MTQKFADSLAGFQKDGNQKWRDRRNCVVGALVIRSLDKKCNNLLQLKPLNKIQKNIDSRKQCRIENTFTLDCL